MCEKSQKGKVSIQLNHNDGARTDQMGSAPGPDIEIELDMSALGLDHAKIQITEEESVQSAWYHGPLGKMETEPDSWRRESPDQ